MSDDQLPQGSKTSMAWHAYFGLSLFFTITGVLSIFAIPNLSFFDAVDFIVSMIAFAGLYGFVYQRPFGKVLFWRYFVYVFLFETILFCFFLPLFEIDRYGQPFQINGWYFFELAYVIVMLRAQQLYAFRRPDIWRRRVRSS